MQSMAQGWLAFDLSRNAFLVGMVAAAQSLPVEVDQKVREIEGVNDVYVTVTWNPPWNKSMMSETAQLELGYL